MTVDDSEPLAPEQKLPTEIWIKILRVVVADLKTKERNGTFHYFPYINDDLYQVPQENQTEQFYEFRTKRLLVLVCRNWHNWCTPWLYEDIVIGKYPCHKLLLRTLQETLSEATSYASLTTFSTSNPDTADSNTLFEIDSIKLAKAGGLGQHVRKITVASVAGETHYQQFLPELLRIFQHCPYVVSLAGCWKQPLVQQFTRGIGQLYGASLTHLSWHHLRSIGRNAEESIPIAQMLLPFISLRVLDIRCFGLNDWYGPNAHENPPGFQLESVSLPTVEHIYISATVQSLALPRLINFPSLSCVTLDATGWGYTKQDFELLLARPIAPFAIWSDLMTQYRSSITYIQIIADTSVHQGPLHALNAFLLLSRCHMEILTRLEIPFVALSASLPTMQISDAFASGATLRCLRTLRRLDLRVNAPPPYNTKASAVFRGVPSSEIWGQCISRTSFSLLERLHIVDRTWVEISKMSLPIRSFMAAFRKLGIIMSDMNGDELTNEMDGD